MATFAEMAEAIWTQLENRPLYPLAEVCANGINPAMRLMALMAPYLLMEWYEVTLPAYSLTLDLRQHAPRTHRILRVLRGAAGGDTPQQTLGAFMPLLPTTLDALSSAHPDWLRRTGLPTSYFLLGKHGVACWPRPPVDVLLTLTCAVVPTAATPETQRQTSAFDATLHDRVIDVAVQLLALKEGHGETEAALERLAALLGLEPAKGAA
jgi:hypothetical protein